MEISLGIRHLWAVKSTQDIVVLVKSMSKGEKRHFRSQALRRANGERSNYMRLFDYFQREKPFDVEQFKRDSAQEFIQKNLSVEQTYLKNQLLRALRDYERGKKEHRKIVNLITDAEILLERGAFHLFQAVLKKARKLAWNGCRFGALMELHALERDYHWKCSGHLTPEVQAQLAQERAQLLKWVQRQMSLWSAEQHLQSFLEALPSKNPLPPLPGFPPLEGEGVPFVIRQLQLHVGSLGRLAQGDHSGAFGLSQAEICLWQAHSDLAQEYPIAFSKSLFHHLILCLKTRNFTAFEDQFHCFVRLFPSGQPGNRSYQIQARYLRARYLLARGHFEEFFEVYPEQTPAMLAQSPGYFYAGALCFAQLFFARRQFQNALFWTRIAELAPQNPPICRTKLHAQFLRILIFFELEEYELGLSAIRSLRRSPASNAAQATFSACILPNLYRLCSRPAHRPLLEQLAATLRLQIAQESESAFRIFLWVWTIAKTKGLPMAEVFTQNRALIQSWQLPA